MLVRGSNFKVLVDVVMESLNLKEVIESRICFNILKECKWLCLMVDLLLFRGMIKEVMFNFLWEVVGKDLELLIKVFFFL